MKADTFNASSETAGRQKQRSKQIGEYLVAAELARQGFLAATFSGNVPNYDILAADDHGNTIPIQVKAVRQGGWSFSVDDFVEVRFEGPQQVFGRRRPPPVSGLMYVLVLIGEKYGDDRFFMISWKELRDLIVKGHKTYLRKHGGVRPRNPESLHTQVRVKTVERFEGKWEKIGDALKSRPA